jgi:hypothetical protein
MHGKCQEELSGDAIMYEQRRTASEKAICGMFREVLISEGAERTDVRNGGLCDLRSRAMSSPGHRLHHHGERTYEEVRTASDERVDA